jgi:hypothetical protein
MFMNNDILRRELRFLVISRVHSYIREQVTDFHFIIAFIVYLCNLKAIRRCLPREKNTSKVTSRDAAEFQFQYASSRSRPAARYTFNYIRIGVLN